MLPEAQEGIIEQTQQSWGEPALEIRGNYSWGFINKQEDSDSDDEEKKAEKLKNTKVDDKPKEKVEEKTVISKIMLKDLNIQF